MADPDARTRRAPAAIVIATLGSLLLVAYSAGLARAHAGLMTSDPAAGASVPEAPETLTLTFTERLDGASATLRLLDESGADVAVIADPALDREGLRLTATLPPLGAGIYTVSYQVVSAVDGHVTSGRFAFLVDPTGTQPPPGAGVSSTAPAADAPAIATRWIALAAALAGFGSGLFWLVVVRSRRQDAPAPKPARAPMPPMPPAALAPPWPLLATTAAIAFAALVSYLALAARPLLAEVTASQGAFPLDPAGPFGWTPFAIAMRTALVALLLAAGVSTWRAVRRTAIAVVPVTTDATGLGTERPRAMDAGSAEERPLAMEAGSGAERPLAMVTVCLLAAALLGMSLAGHAASIGGPAFATFDWVHLLAAGAWLGPIPAFAVLASRARGAGLPVGATLRAALVEHSRVAVVAAPLVALTGVANSPLVVGDARGVVGSEYGNLVLGKVLLFSVAIGIGAANHFVVRGARWRIGPLLAAELAVATLAVLVAATMVTIPPATNRQPTTPTAAIGAAHMYGRAGGTIVHVAVNLPSPGTQRYQVVLSDAVDGRPPDDVGEVALTFRPPTGAGLRDERVMLAEQSPGLYGASGAHTPLVGEWRLEVGIGREGARETVTFALPVTEPMTTQALLPPDTGVGIPGLLAAAWPLLPAGAAGWAPSMALLGVSAVLLGVSVARRRRGLPRARVTEWSALAALILAVSTASVAGSRALIEAANAVPRAAATAVSPVAVSGESVARGERIYRANCSGCHGANGEGDGPIAAELAVRLRPLDDVVPERTDGELAYRIASGLVGLPMPAFAAILSDTDRWDLVNYLRERHPARR